MLKWIPLHVHSEFSTLDGAIQVKRYINWAQKHQLPAVALTDHGNLSCIPLFDEKGKKGGIKPIFGMEAYMEPIVDKGQEEPHHMVLLAKNKNGLKKLYTLSSDSYQNTRGKYPVVKKELLKEALPDLIVLSACVQGELPHLVKNKDEDALKQFLSFFSGADFFVELVDIDTPEQDSLNKLLLDVSETYNIPAVVTPDAHYFPEDKWWYPTLWASNKGQSIEEVENRYNISEQDWSLPDPEKVIEKWKSHPEVIKNTMRIADMIENITVPFDTYQMPKLQSNVNLKSLAESALEEKVTRYGLSRSEYFSRLAYELDVLINKGFSDYMLLVRDIIKSAREKGIYVGPGRGSAAGSLVAWALDITRIDPIYHGLLFERFINPERNEFPDIDIDVEDKRREEVIEDIKQKYGQDSVTGIANFSGYKYKIALRDAVCALCGGKIKAGSPEDMFLKAARECVIEVPEESTGEKFESFDAEAAIQKTKDFFPEHLSRKAIEVVEKIKGLTRQRSRHAAGIVVTPGKVDDYCPTMKVRGVKVAQFDKKGIEYVKLVKIDILGLSNLRVIKETREAVKQYVYEVETPEEIYDYLNGHGKVSEMKAKRMISVSYEDPDGLFQTSGPGMKKLIKKVKPQNVRELSDIIALFRPGPLQNKWDDSYVKKTPPEELKIPAIMEITKDTRGIPIYQEQIMKMVQVIAGFSLAKADLLRRAIGKKKFEEMAKLKPEFVEGAIKNGYDEETAEKLFSVIEKFAGYGFNKSHSMSYAFLNYATAWYKANYTPAWTKALLDFRIENEKRETIGKYIDESQRFCRIVPPTFFEGDTRLGDALETRLVKTSNAISSPDEIFLSGSWIISLGIKTVYHVKDKADAAKDMPLPKDLFELLTLSKKHNLHKSVFASLFSLGTFDFILKKYHENPRLLRAVILSLDSEGLMEKIGEAIGKIIPRGKKDLRERLSGYPAALSLLLIALEKGITEETFPCVEEVIKQCAREADADKFASNTEYRLKLLSVIYETEKYLLGSGVTIPWWAMASESVLYRFYDTAEKAHALAMRIKTVKNTEVVETFQTEGLWFIGKKARVFYRNGRPTTVITGKYEEGFTPIYINKEIKEDGFFAVKVKLSQNGYLEYVDHKPIRLGQITDTGSEFFHTRLASPEIKQYVKRVI